MKPKYTFALPKIFTAVSAFLLVTGTAAFAFSGAGTGSDPLISLSYAKNTYTSEILGDIKANAQNEFNKTNDNLNKSLDDINNMYSDAELENELARQTAKALGYNIQEKDISPRLVVDAFTNGTKLQLAKTTEICVTSGSAQLSSGSLINLSTGKTITVGSPIIRNQLYISPSAGNVITLTSPVKINISGTYTKLNDGKPTYNAKYTAYADALNDLGLFSGSDTGYNLERSSTRAEGLVMLIRLLGEEDRALKYKGTHPFKDVPQWVDRYVAYAYEKGYTSGITATSFGSQNTLSLNDYMTFLLRALEYDDKKGDFSWATSGEAAVKAGIITASELDDMRKRSVLYRDDLVYTSYNTLFINCKNESFRLCDKLLAAGIFTETKLSFVQNQMP